jgi:hypothetical protein
MTASFETDTVREKTIKESENNRLTDFHYRISHNSDDLGLFQDLPSIDAKLSALYFKLDHIQEMLNKGRIKYD